MYMFLRVRARIYISQRPFLWAQIRHSENENICGNPQPENSAREATKPQRGLPCDFENSLTHLNSEFILFLWKSAPGFLFVLFYFVLQITVYSCSCESSFFREIDLTSFLLAHANNYRIPQTSSFPDCLPIWCIKNNNSSNPIHGFKIYRFLTVTHIISLEEFFKDLLVFSLESQEQFELTRNPWLFV